MTVYWDRNGVGPFYIDDVNIPAGDMRVALSIDGEIGTGVTSVVIVAIQLTAAKILQVKTQAVENGMIVGVPSDWIDVTNFSLIADQLADHEARITALENP